MLQCCLEDQGLQRRKQQLHRLVCHGMYCHFVAADDLALIAGIHGQGAATSLAALLPKVLHLRQNKTTWQSATQEKVSFDSELQLIEALLRNRRFMCIQRQVAVCPAIHVTELLYFIVSKHPMPYSSKRLRWLQWLIEL